MCWMTQVTKMIAWTLSLDIQVWLLKCNSNSKIWWYQQTFPQAKGIRWKKAVVQDVSRKHNSIVTVGIASDNVLWCRNDEKSMRHHKKHVSRHVESILAYHFGSNLRIILLYINSPSFGPSSSVSYLSRNWASFVSYYSLPFAALPSLSQYNSYRADIKQRMRRGETLS